MREPTTKPLQQSPEEGRVLQAALDRELRESATRGSERALRAEEKRKKRAAKLTAAAERGAIKKAPDVESR